MLFNVVLQVLYEIGDLVSCQEYVQKALRLSPYFERGLELQELVRQRLEEVQPHATEDQMHTDEPSPLIHAVGGPKELILDELSWEELGDLLLEEYKALLKSPEKTFYNQRLVVVVSKQSDNEDVEMTEDTATTEMTEVEPEDAQPEEQAALTEKTDAESPSAEPVEVAMDVLPTDEVASLADRELVEADQGAALKRKRKEVEERSGLR